MNVDEVLVSVFRGQVTRFGGAVLVQQPAGGEWDSLLPLGGDETSRWFSQTVP
jgi:hypothetical protein